MSRRALFFIIYPDLGGPRLEPPDESVPAVDKRHSDLGLEHPFLGDRAGATLLVAIELV